VAYFLATTGILCGEIWPSSRGRKWYTLYYHLQEHQNGVII